jgi:hypothetical protein
MSAMPSFFKRLESRIAIALARAEAAFAGISSLSNSLNQANAAPVGPANAVSWTSSAFIPRTGFVRIGAQMTVTGTGGTAVAGDAITFSIVRDGATVIGAPLQLNIAPGTLVTSAGTLLWEDSVTPGTSHTWAIRATDFTGGHTLLLPTGLAMIQLLELPG